MSEFDQSYQKGKLFRIKADKREKRVHLSAGKDSLLMKKAGFYHLIKKIMRL